MFVSEKVEHNISRTPSMSPALSCGNKNYLCIGTATMWNIYQPKVNKPLLKRTKRSTPGSGIFICFRGQIILIQYCIGKDTLIAEHVCWSFKAFTIIIFNVNTSFAVHHLCDAKIILIREEMYKQMTCRREANRQTNLPC